jgi:hypothetical protein
MAVCSPRRIYILEDIDIDIVCYMCGMTEGAKLKLLTWVRRHFKHSGGLCFFSNSQLNR